MSNRKSAQAKLAEVVQELGFENCESLFLLLRAQHKQAQKAAQDGLLVAMPSISPEEHAITAERDTRAAAIGGAK